MFRQENLVLREQIIGEGRAFETCARDPEKAYENLVKQITQTQKEKDGYASGS